ncbi:SMI1/KNR4 family protein [Streptomyces kronopolitis]|uniref:SMI1/KNR4 family protein n=1 Tax=Streptomyces kronopolitis TaxID=1612435 RepID=UPI00343645D2
MWREVAGHTFPEAGFSSVDATQVAAAEQRLRCAPPSEIVSLLLETDGILGPYGVETVWPLKRIVEDNLHFWSDSPLTHLYMPFAPLLFFGDNSGGDQFAFVRKPSRPMPSRGNTRMAVAAGSPGTCWTISASLSLLKETTGTSS